MTILEFVKLAIETGKAKSKADGKEYKGLHTVYSGLNEEIRTLFGNESWDKETRKAFPITEVKKMVEQGQLESHYAHGGVMLYLKGEMPNIKSKVTKESIMKKYNLVAPPVITPAEAKRSKREAKPQVIAAQA
jgi:hypothetical protein